jgi:hypothetical protein
MNDKLGRIWKETAVELLTYYPGICLEELKMTTPALVRISGIPVNILTELLPNACLKRHRHGASAVGKICHF